MVNIQTAENALKQLYLGVLSEQLNIGVNPLLAKIGKTTADVWGKEIVHMAPYGINGGVGAGTEDGQLPNCGGNNYAQFKLALKNFFGKIEISDKAVRASSNSQGAFVNLLNAEMEGLLKASKFNFGRMLFGDGTGLIAVTKPNSTSVKNKINVDSVRNLMEGMIIDLFDEAGNVVLSSTKIVCLDRVARIVTLSKSASTVVGENCKIYVQGSKDNEMTGLNALFGDSATLYGLNRNDYSFLKPYQEHIASGVSISAIQTAIDQIEEIAGGNIDFIVSSFDVRRDYIDYLSMNRSNLDYMNLDGGFKAISYSGIPFVADRFVEDGAMYLLNSEDFKLHQLCDWRWLEGEGGTVLHQIAGKPVYSATLVKYADLLCERPMGQAKLTFDLKSAKKPNTYKMMFDTVGGSTIPTQYIAENNFGVSPANPVKNGFSFVAWYYNGAPFNFSHTPVTEDMVLVASWSN